MVDPTHKLLVYFNEIQGMVAVIFGMFLQFFLGDQRGFKMAITIATSSIFVALFIMPAVLEILKIEQTGKVAVAMYALSAIVSVEIIAVFLTVVPRALRTKLVSFLGIKDV
jgi:hypothetical protein